MPPVLPRGTLRLGGGGRGAGAVSQAAAAPYRAWPERGPWGRSRDTGVPTGAAAEVLAVVRGSGHCGMLPGAEGPVLLAG